MRNLLVATASRFLSAFLVALVLRDLLIVLDLRLLYMKA
jgi:hypothetical protein